VKYLYATSEATIDCFDHLLWCDRVAREQMWIVSRLRVKDPLARLIFNEFVCDAFERVDVTRDNGREERKLLQKFTQ
jgi:hypothetical protein